MTQLADFQELMELTYGERDRARGIPSTIAWLAEEVGELAKAVRKGSREDQIHEVGDVLAWLASLANQLGISFEAAVDRYRSGCSRCRAVPCCCGAATS
jgi:NTP pyrophosphatase (non-canonical NTP hydrolase)